MASAATGEGAPGGVRVVIEFGDRGSDDVRRALGGEVRSKLVSGHTHDGTGERLLEVYVPLRQTRGGRFIYGVRGGRVTFVGTVNRRQAAQPHAVAARLRRLGLAPGG